MKKILLLFAVLLFIPLAVAAPSGYSDPDYFSLSADFDLSASDDAIFKTAYYSIGGNNWQSFELLGQSFGSSWLKNYASASLPESLFVNQGESYLAVYSCSSMSVGQASNQRWSCHDGQWQLLSFTVTEEIPSATIVAVSASESQDNAHLPENSLDGVSSATSYWAAEGDNQWISYELSEMATVSFVEVSFYADSSRVFEIQSSWDGVVWTSVAPEFSSALNSPYTMQRFEFTPVQAKYIRFLGHGSTKTGRNGWNTVCEMNINDFEVDISGTNCVSNNNECGNDGCGDVHSSCSSGACVGGSCVAVSDLEPEIVFFNNFEHHDVGGYVDRLDDWTDCFCNSGERIYQNTGDVENPSKSYRFFFPNGTWSLGRTERGCDGFRCDFVTSEGWDELYFSYRVRFSTGFLANKGGKLPRIKGEYGDGRSAGQCPDGSNGFTGGQMFTDRGPRPVPRFYIAHMNVWNVSWYTDQYVKKTGEYPTSCQDYYDEGFSGIVPTSYNWDNPPMPTGHWYTVTERIVLNTPGKANGIAEAFIDGELVAQVTGLKYRSIPELKINTFMLVSFFGGGNEGWASPQDQYIYFDDVVGYYYPATNGDIPIGNVPWTDGVPLPSVPFPDGPVYPTRATCEDSPWTC